MERRTFLRSIAGTMLVARPALAHRTAAANLREVASAAEPFARLRDGPVRQLAPEEEAQRLAASAAPAGPPGRWTRRASLPIARSEMNWAVALGGRMHVIGGYGEGRVDRAYHHVCNPVTDS